MPCHHHFRHQQARVNEAGACRALWSWESNGFFLSRKSSRPAAVKTFPLPHEWQTITLLMIASLAVKFAPALPSDLRSWLPQGISPQTCRCLTYADWQPRTASCSVSAVSSILGSPMLNKKRQEALARAWSTAGCNDNAKLAEARHFLRTGCSSEGRPPIFCEIFSISSSSSGLILAHGTKPRNKQRM